MQWRSAATRRRRQRTRWHWVRTRRRRRTCRQRATTPGTAALSGTASTANGEVSMGSAGKERRVTNVAAGSAATDAVNVSQLQSEDAKVNTINNNVNNLSTTVNNIVITVAASSTST
ncbi:hypothetical protein ACFFYR_10420 [Paraburkholderia dipogonis]|uniref:hypothetical protein n=1 Tax=Paraburkholderia dipogonis TaxID=1211383 RepID=UPI0035E8DE67